MIDYSESATCRHSGILAYFQDSQRLDRCGHCDACAPASAQAVQAPPRQRPPRAPRVGGRDPQLRALLPTEEALCERLRAWRRDWAKANDWAAFMVFSDKTLRALAQARPVDRKQLLAVHGMGPVKIEQFGEALLRTLAESP
jgi:ATP-dependent DNA helicase RecQ